MTLPADHGPLEVERRFFAALLAADGAALAEVLADDFVLVDVMQGGEIPRAALIDAVATRQIQFDAVDVVEARVRRYGGTAVVVGRTRMRGGAGDQAWSVASRYTHVYVELGAGWRLVSAQGTPIAGA